MLTKNKILLSESSKDIFFGILRSYERIYVYSGRVKGAENIADGFMDGIDYHLSDYKAGKALNTIYSEYVHTTEIGLLNRVLDDADASIVFKKEIMRELLKIFFSFALAEKFLIKYSIKESIDFIPDSFNYRLYRLLLKHKLVNHDRICIPQRYLDKLKKRGIYANLIYRLGLVFYPLTLTLLMKVEKMRKIAKRNFRYGVYIWKSGIDFRFPPYNAEFLESEKGVNPSTAIYVIEGKMDKDRIAKIKTNGYVSCSFEELTRGFCLWQYLKDVLPSAYRLSRQFMSGNSTKSLVNKCYLKTLRLFILWEMFYSKFNVETFVAFQEPANSIRVLLQKKHGSRNIFVYLSTQFDPVYRQDMNTHIETNYGFMFFDAVISSRMTNKYLMKNNNRIKEYLESGIVLSDTIFNININSQLKAKIKRDLGLPLNKIIVGFFDAGIDSAGFVNVGEGKQILEDIYRLLESNERYFVIFKTRNEAQSCKFTDITEEMGKFTQHERVFFANALAPQYKTNILMGISDLVIGVFSSSIPQESVAGGTRTVCYTPERYNRDDFILNTFPHFSAHNYDELSQYCQYWLNYCSDDDFKKFQDNYIKKYIDGFCDGRATERLHSIIESYGRAAVARESLDKKCLLSDTEITVGKG